MKEENILFLKSKEVIEILRIHPRTLKNYRDEGKIEFIKINSRKFLYPAENVYRLLQKGSCCSVHKDRGVTLITQMFLKKMSSN